MSAYVDARLADYQPEPLHISDNTPNTPNPETQSKLFSPNRMTKSENIAPSSELQLNDRRLPTLPQGLPGRRHPATAVAQMTGFTLAGVILAAGHHVYFTSLHLTPSDGVRQIAGHSVSDQALANFIATLFIFLVKLCLSQSVAKAFDQRLWYTVRRSSMKLTGLDALFSVLGDPIAFLDFEMVWRAKVAAGLAFIAWTGTFAVIPVPGSLTVQSIQTQSTEDVSVPTVDLAKDFATGPLYTSSPIRAYNNPAPIAQNVANRALIEMGIATWPSPCGDCSYNLTFFAPSFSCSAPTSAAIQARIPSWNAQKFPGAVTDILDVEYISDFQGNILSKTNCTSFNSTYSISVNFRANQQRVEVLGITAGPQFGTEGTIIIDDPTFVPALAAVKDAVSNALLGSVFQNLQQGLDVTNGTLVLLSAFANNTFPTNPVFRTDTPQLIESLLTNTTLSLISRSLWTTSTRASIVRTHSVFVYRPRVLWAGYAAAVGVALLGVAIGLHALWRNGGGGGKAFSLIVATTRNPALDAVTNRALQQKEYRKTYQNLRFRYTHLDTGEGQHRDRLAFCES